MINRWESMARGWATAVLVAGLGLASSASATLISRGADLVYDDVLDITWTRNANLPGSSGLTWAQADAWAAGLSYGGFDDWRLPTINMTSPTNNATHCGAVTAEACAASGNELGYMFHQNLNGATSANMTGTQTALGGQILADIQTIYWSGTEQCAGSCAWIFFFDGGIQFSIDSINPSNQHSAWAVRTGDVGTAVPEPASLPLLLAGMLGLGWSRQRGRR